MPSVAAIAADVHRELSTERALLTSWTDAILETQMAIAKIPSPTFGEGRRAAWVAERLEHAGWRVRMDAAGNVVARADHTDRPALGVCAHLDTVYADDGSPEPQRHGSRVAAPGICDNGRGLAVLIGLGRALAPRAGALGTPLELVATVAEEGAGDLHGARHYVATCAPLAMIALDGAGDERVVRTALGSRRLRVAFTGPGGHSWSAFGVANPVHAAARTASRVASLALGADTALTVSRIGGGVSVNAIPEEGWLEVDIRGISEPILASLERDVRLAAEWAAREENARRTGGEALRCVVQRIGHRACGATPEQSPLVQAAVAGTRLVGRAPELATASTDANAAIAAGIPAIAVGAGGRGGDVHSAREWFDNTDAARGVERALTIVATAARVLGTG